MIKDNIQRRTVYYSVSQSLKQGFEWIINNDLKSLANGIYEINENVYASVQSYITKDDAPYEAHRDYIDIQYMISGEELSGVTDYSNCATKEEYKKEKDIEFLYPPKNEEYFKIKEGEFFVFFPHDAHKPAIKINDNKLVKKAVVKVKA